LVLATFGDTDFLTINSLVNLLMFKRQFLNVDAFWLCELLGVMLVLGGCVKSAQFGFHIWLLEAMEAPLGASALMHSSTLVVAGLALIFKLQTLIELSGTSQLLMFWLGVFSALFASFVACFQYELKPIMAYSTISNMGYMFILLALGAYREVILIMVLHAYIKIFLFLVVGGIMLHCNGCQDLRWMGGLHLYIPTLFTAYTVGGVCLVGLPF
jgi:NADH:ubiquinone oxidoreductase subunit 5 (subunit L)/multisubunit Na+/H+ antiporter MnhA subunit